MLTHAMAFEDELRRIIGEQIEGAKDRLVSAPFDSIGGFEAIRGEIRAYVEVLSAIEEAKKRVDKRMNA